MVLPSRMEPMNCRITPTPPRLAMVPACGAMSPATSRNSVVFPAPLGPIRADLEPSPTRNDTSLNSTRPSPST